MRDYRKKRKKDLVLDHTKLINALDTARVASTETERLIIIELLKHATTCPSCHKRVIKIGFSSEALMITYLTAKAWPEYDALMKNKTNEAEGKEKEKQ